MPVRASRVVLLLLLGLAPAVGSCWLATEAHAAWVAWSGPAAAVDTAVVAAAGTAGAVVSAWLALGALVSGACVLAGSAHRPAFVPAVLHRSVALVLGVALAARAAPVPTAGTGAGAGVDPAWRATGPAAAADPVRPTATTTATAAPDPGWRPVQAPAPVLRRVAEPIDPILLTGARASASAHPGTEPVTVHRGDTLWDLAARHLGGQAGDAEIAAEWPRWYAANRDTIGADPDLLVPGQQLRPPGRLDDG